MRRLTENLVSIFFAVGLILATYHYFTSWLISLINTVFNTLP